jgi:hypothetical protein
VALVVVAAALAYEWGVGNEVFTPWVSLALLNRFGDTTAGSLAAAGAVASFTFAQQVAVGLLTLFALVSFPQLSASCRASVKRRFGVTVPSWHALPKLQAIAISFSLGGTFVAVQQTMADAKRRRRTILISAALSAVGVFVVVGVVGALAQRAQGTAAEQSVELAMSVLSNPLLWLALAFGPSIVKAVRRRSRLRVAVADAEGAD